MVFKKIRSICWPSYVPGRNSKKIRNQFVPSYTQHYDVIRGLTRSGRNSEGLNSEGVTRHLPIPLDHDHSLKRNYFDFFNLYVHVVTETIFNHAYVTMHYWKIVHD